MDNADSEIDRKKRLRSRAVELIHKNPQDVAALPPQDIAELASELSIYQMELEMQNEELRRSQADLEYSRRKYADLYDFAPVGYFVLDQDGVTVEGNLTGATLLGMERSAVIGKPFFRFVLPEDKEKYSLFRRKVLETQDSQILEIRLLRKNKSSFYALLQGLTVPNPEGDVLQCRIAVTDISERRKAEDALYLSQESLALAVHEAKIGIFDWDVLAGKIAWTVQHEIIFGYEPTSTTTTTTTTTVPHSYDDFVKRLHPDDAPYVEARTQQSMADRTLFQAEYRIIWPDGSVHWVSASGQFHYDGSGRAVRMVGAVQDITKRKAVEQRLEYLASFPANNPNPVMEVDLSGCVCYKNPAALEIFPDLLEQGSDHPYLSGLGAVSEAFEKDKKKTFSREVKVHDAWFEQSFHFLTDSKLIRIYGWDITKRRAAEVAVKQNQARLRRVLHGSNDGFWDWNLADGKVFVSARWWQIAGMKGSVRDLRMEDMDHLIHPEDIPKVQAAVLSVVEGRAGKDLYEVECRYCRPDGSSAWVNIRGAVIDRDAAGRAKQVSGATTDISARIRAEEDLRVSQERYRNLVLASPEAIVVHQAGRIVFVNPVAMELFKAVDKKELLGRPVLSLISKASRVHAKQRLRQTPTEEVPKAEIEFARFDGTLFEGEVMGQSVMFDGKPGVHFVIRDISDRKKVEEILKRDRVMLKKLVDEKAIELMEVQQEVERSKRLSDIGMLAATVAHELRTPLGVIRVAAYNIKQKAPGPLLAKNLENIEKKVVESNQIINNLLFYSRFRKATPERIRIHDLLEECVQSASDRFHECGIRLEKKYDAIKNIWGELDPLQIKEVFNNLLANAFEAIPGGKGRVKVAADFDPKNSELAVTFEDTGVGILEEDFSRIREPFFSTKSKGTGLGLTVCYQIVKNHNGRIDVKSSKGKGTAFTVILPYAGCARA